MASVTLHKLLWGVEKYGKASDWTVRAGEVPAIGLPSRAAMALFLAVRDKPPPNDWDIEHGPLVWRLMTRKRILASGRRAQLGYSDSNMAENWRNVVPLVKRSSRWDVPPHPAYYIPLAHGSEVHVASYLLYCDVLLLLTALDGGERILDSLVRWGLAGVPFEDRWHWRSGIHLEEETWTAVDDVVRWASSPCDDSTVTDALVKSIDESWCRFSLDDFDAERIDLLLQEGNFLEVVRSVDRFGQSPNLPEGLKLPKLLAGDLRVRIAQVSEWYSNVPQSFPSVSPHEAQAVMQQVAASFDRRASNSRPDMILLPEVSIPQNEVRTLRKLVAKTGVAALAGLYWRALPAAYPRRNGQSADRVWIVNEAELVVPLGHDTIGPPTVRWFRVRKPVPAHLEEGLARSVKKQSGEELQILKGRRWYRFVHPQWGDFSVAICADLIDAKPWCVFRGEILHLFTVAFNKDVELYDALTWVRAYESYVNVLSVNHGRYGGSFVWTPKHSHGRELARLRGSDLFLLADVEVPVKSLLDAQHRGVKRAIDAAKRKWTNRPRKPVTFKAPPPGYRRRNYRN